MNAELANGISAAVGGSSKGDLLGEQEETGSEGVLCEDLWPAVVWRFWWG